MTLKALGILPDLYLPIKKPTFSYTSTIFASKAGLEACLQFFLFYLFGSLLVQ